MSKPPSRATYQSLNNAFLWFTPVGVALVLGSIFLAKKCSENKPTARVAEVETSTSVSASVSLETFPFSLPATPPPKDMEGMSVALAMVAGYEAQADHKIEDALWYFNYAWKSNPRAQDLAYYLGCIALTQNETSKALQLFQLSIARNEQVAFSFNLVGIQLQKMGQLEKAEEAFIRGAKADPLNANTYYNLGNLNREKNDFKRALECYSMAVKLKPTDDLFSIKKNLTLIQADKGDDLEEKARLQLLIEPDSTVWLLTAAVFHLKNKQGPLAAEKLTKARNGMYGPFFQEMMKDPVFQKYSTVLEVSSLIPLEH